MRETLEIYDRWAGRNVALATVVRVQGSAPRPVGTTMLIAGEGDMEGSVSGGCVENDVSLHAVASLNERAPKLVTYGIADDEAFEVGLMCGGTIQVYIRPANIDTLEAARPLVEGERYGAVATVLDGGEGEAVLDAEGRVLAGSLPAAIQHQIVSDAVVMMDQEKSKALAYGDTLVFIDTITPFPSLLIFGAVHIAQYLSSMARMAGFRVSVADSRAAFATEERFPDADEILIGWPDAWLDKLVLDRRTYAAILNHDARHEDPVLKELLQSEARYIGAMGSRKTHAARLERLGEASFDVEDLARIHGPIGLDISAESPAEVAVSILGEMIRVRYGAGSGLSLQGTTGPIHATRSDG